MLLAEIQLFAIHTPPVLTGLAFTPSSALGLCFVLPGFLLLTCIFLSLDLHLQESWGQGRAGG